MYTACESKPQLKVIEFAIGNLCNMQPSCLTCFSQCRLLNNNEKIFADIRVVHKVIEYIPRIEKLFLGGLGEPSIHPLFWKIIENGRGKVVFITNGLFLNEETAPLIADNVLGITISLDAASPKMYALMRKDEVTFLRIIKNIKNIIRLRKNQKTPIVNLSFVISKANLSEVYDFVILASDIGVDLVTLTTLNDTFKDNYRVERNGYCWDYQREIVSAQDANLRDVVIRAVSFAQRCGINVKTNMDYNYIADVNVDFTNIGESDYFIPKGACQRPWWASFVKPDGAVTLCCHTWHNTIGNILNDDLEELIINSGIVNSVRNDLKNRALPTFCKNCFWLPDIVKFNGFNYHIPEDEFRVIREKKSLIFRGRVKNTGNCMWSNKGLQEQMAYKLGGRIFHYENERETLVELRDFFSAENITPGSYFDFELKTDIANLPKGSYLLKIDLVKERCFWFEDKGLTPLRIKFDIPYDDTGLKIYYDIRS